jgi:glucose/arabinose dehydrogenase
MQRWRQRAVAGLVALAGAAAGAAADPPEGFVRELVLSGLDQPIDLAFLPDGRCLVLEKGGMVWIVDVDRDPATAAPYLELPEIDPLGAWSMALPADPGADPSLSVYYAHDATERFRVARFAHLGDHADPCSAILVWQDANDWYPINIHRGSGIAFGPDGMLYLTVGEEQEGPQAQDLTRSGGKAVRIDRDGLIPPDNPFIDGPGGNDDSIWALGLRNPFRAAWDMPSRRFLIADVGGFFFEELNLGVRGANYGWPMCEGAVCDDAAHPKCVCVEHSDPIFAYPTPGSAAIVGGFVYRGDRFPRDPYFGAYFYGDYMRQHLRYVTFDADEATVTGDAMFDPSVGRIVALDQGTDGGLYFLEHLAGKLWRIAATVDDAPPVVIATSADPAEGGAPLAVSLSADAIDPEGGAIEYRWRLGDGGSASGQEVEHVYAERGRYQAWVEVSDAGRTTLAGPVLVDVGQPPVVSVDSPRAGALFRAGDEIVLGATFSDPDEPLQGADVGWIVRRFHQGKQQVVYGPASGAGGSFMVPISGVEFEASSGYEIIATAFDSDGFTATDSVSVYADTVTLALETQPPGLMLVLDGVPVEAPLAVSALVDMERVVGAASQCVDGVLYGFAGWSDGGGPFHSIVVPGRDLTLIATFTPGGPASGDVNQDGQTNSTDMVGVILGWGACPPGVSCPADQDCSGVVDVLDLLLVILNWTIQP